MKNLASAVVVVVLMLSVAPADAQETQNCSEKSLEARLQNISLRAVGQVGVAAQLIESGEIVSLRASQHFPMQSVYKLPIAMAVLQRVEQKKLDLSQKIIVDKKFYSPVHSPIRDKYPDGGAELTLEQLVAASIVDSDGVAVDVLLSLVSPEEATEYVRGLGIRDIVIATTEKEMSEGEMVQYRNWATPQAAVSLLKALQQGSDGLSAAHRELLLKWMTQSVPGGKRLKGLLPDGTVVSHKTGTSGTTKGMTRATNDIGVVTLPDGRHIAIAVFVSDSTASEEIREGVIAESARAIWDCWSARK